MQGWGHWVIILIGVAVWIFTHLLKAGNEQQQQQRRQQPQGQGGGAPPRRAGGDIDRFLQEIQRRRQEGGKKQAPAASVPPAPVSREPPPRPQRPPPLPQVPRRAERTPGQRQRASERPRPVVPPVEVVVLEEVQPSEATAGIAEANVAPSERAAYRAPTVSAVRAPTQGAQKLVELLRTKEGLQAAILMNEVIGPPRCKRHRGI